MDYQQFKALRDGAQAAGWVIGYTYNDHADVIFANPSLVYATNPAAKLWLSLNRPPED